MHRRRSATSRPVRIYLPRFGWRNAEPMKQMNKKEKDQLAEEVVDRWISFQMALSNKRTYPAREFTDFATSVREYARIVGRDTLIHREVAGAINGLVDFLKVERRHVPDAVIYEASRLQTLLFSGYDPHFEGDEPPGLQHGTALWALRNSVP